jgi:hypothetical protein
MVTDPNGRGPRVLRRPLGQHPSQSQGLLQVSGTVCVCDHCTRERSRDIDLALPYLGMHAATPTAHNQPAPVASLFFFFLRVGACSLLSACLLQWLNNQDSCRASSIYRINIALRRENVFKKGCFTVHQCNLNCPIGLILQSRSNILPQIFIVYSVPRDIFYITLFISCIQFSD